MSIISGKMNMGTDKTKILIVTQYFWPENFKINDVAIGLLGKGYEVSVLTGQPNYPKGNIYEGYSNFHNRRECYQGINIHRAFVIPRGKGSGLRLFLNYISLAFFIVAFEKYM